MLLVGSRNTRRGPFEEAHRLLGELLGLDSGNSETDGAPDPWWGLGDHWMVFEDEQGGDANGAIGVNKARQVASHPTWLRSELELEDADQVLPVLLTPKRRMRRAAAVHLGGVSYWRLEDFRAWASHVFAVLRDLHGICPGEGDLGWREAARDRLVEEGLDFDGIFQSLSGRMCVSEMESE